MKKESAPANTGCLCRMLQIINVLCILGLLANAVVRFTLFGAGEDAPKDPFFYLMTIYLIPFCFLLISAELKWTRVLKYVQFLGYQHGKGLFFIFIALLVFDTERALDVVVSLVVTFVGIFNMITACIRPALNHLSFLNLPKDKASDDDDEYDSETSAEDSDIDPHEHDALLPGSVKSRSRAAPDSNAESMAEDKLGVDSEASYKMGRFTKTKKRD